MSNYLNKTLEIVAADLQSENGSAMRLWDNWRSAIASGDTSSWPRDAYEAQMQVIGELLKEAAKENTRMSDIGTILRDVIEKLRSELADVKDAAASEAERVNELTAENKTLREENARLAALASQASLEASQLREALNGWQKWWELPWQDRRPDTADVCWKRSHIAIREGGKDD